MEQTPIFFSPGNLIQNWPATQHPSSACCLHQFINDKLTVLRPQNLTPNALWKDTVHQLNRGKHGKPPNKCQSNPIKLWMEKGFHWIFLQRVFAWRTLPFILCPSEPVWNWLDVFINIGSMKLVKLKTWRGTINYVLFSSRSNLSGVKSFHRRSVLYLDKLLQDIVGARWTWGGQHVALQLLAKGCNHNLNTILGPAL